MTSILLVKIYIACEFIFSWAILAIFSLDIYYNLRFFFKPIPKNQTQIYKMIRCIPELFLLIYYGLIIVKILSRNYIDFMLSIYSLVLSLIIIMLGTSLLWSSRGRYITYIFEERENEHRRSHKNF